jgi:hypothetical protein
VDDDLFARSVATLCGVIWASTLNEKDITKAIAYADVFLENIDPFAAREDIKLTLERK